MRRTKYHIIFWLAYSIYSCITDYITEPPGEFNILEKSIVLLSNPILSFYLSLLSISFFSPKNLKGFIRGAFVLLVSLLIFFVVKYVIRINAHIILNQEYVPISSFKKFFTNGMLWFVHFFLWALGFHYSIKLTSKERDLEIERLSNEKLKFEKIALLNKNLELHNHNLELQSAKIKSDYNFLKAQINPHFLYNTLNFFYARTSQTDEKAAEGIALLTEIMRYSLQPGTDGKVDINDEITHLNNYLRLQQLRFDNKLNVRFENNITGNAHYRILPHIFITLVENAFKHGDIRNAAHPLTLQLFVENQNLKFAVHNKVRKVVTETMGTGVGLVNVLERLRMEYGNNVTMEYGEQEGLFTVVLAVPLDLITPQTKPIPVSEAPQPMPSLATAT